VLCECERAECLQRLEVSAGLYAEVRRDSDRFLVIAGHEDADVERVVAGEAYSVVRVRPAARGVPAPSPLPAA
jgi:CTP:molybdopterin cytidylyltransferase MocA